MCRPCSLVLAILLIYKAGLYGDDGFEPTVANTKARRDEALKAMV